MEHTIPQHSRTYVWEGGDHYRLLPGQKEEGFWLSNILLINAEKATAAGNKVPTLNSDMFKNGHTLQRKISEVQVSSTLSKYSTFRGHSCTIQPWQALVPSCCQPRREFSVYLDSLYMYDGAGAKMAFSRVNNFLTCCVFISTWTLKNWKYFVIPSSDIAQQLNGDECGVFVAS